MATVKTSDECELHWVSRGSGPAVLLIHGFASTLGRNWEGPGWLSTLERAGYRAIAYDQRGHGESSKFHDPQRYDPERLADDAVAVLDAAGEDRAVVGGYSMGANVALLAALRHPGRVRALVLGGTGAKFFPSLGGPKSRNFETVARALEAKDAAGSPRAALAYRKFAERNHQDLRALAACWRRPRRYLEREELVSIEVPALIVIGTEDDLAGDGAPLAEALPRGQLVRLVGKNHMTAVGARKHREAAVRFLENL